MRDDLAIQHMTMEDSETINSCVVLAYGLFYGKKKMLSTEDERVSKERILEVIRKLMPDRDMEEE